MVALSVLYRPAHGHVPCDIRQLVSDVVTAPRPADMMPLYPPGHYLKWDGDINIACPQLKRCNGSETF